MSDAVMHGIDDVSNWSILRRNALGQIALDLRKKMNSLLEDCTPSILQS